MGMDALAQGFFGILFRLLASVGAYIRLTCQALWIIIRNPPPWALIQTQFFDIGVRSLPVIAFTGASTGLVLATQSFFQLADKGLASATGIMVAKAMITELGPTLTAFMVTGRIGAAMCAELGSMRVSEQIDALRSMAVNPIRYLVAPRLIGGTVMLVLLTTFSTLTGILGGYLISVYYFGMTPNTYWEPLPYYIHTFDLVGGLVKSLAFGILFTTISCYKGMTTSGGAAGVGRSITQSVVICYSYILFFNFLLTLLMNLIHRRMMLLP